MYMYIIKMIYSDSEDKIIDDENMIQKMMLKKCLHIMFTVIYKKQKF